MWLLPATTCHTPRLFKSMGCRASPISPGSSPRFSELPWPSLSRRPNKHRQVGWASSPLRFASTAAVPRPGLTIPAPAPTFHGVVLKPGTPMIGASSEVDGQHTVTQLCCWQVGPDLAFRLGAGEEVARLLHAAEYATVASRPHSPCCRGRAGLERRRCCCSPSTTANPPPAPVVRRAEYFNLTRIAQLIAKPQIR